MASPADSVQEIEREKYQEREYEREMMTDRNKEIRYTEN